MGLEIEGFEIEGFETEDDIPIGATLLGVTDPEPGLLGLALT